MRRNSKKTVNALRNRSNNITCANQMKTVLFYNITGTVAAKCLQPSWLPNDGGQRTDLGFTL